MRCVARPFGTAAFAGVGYRVGVRRHVRLRERLGLTGAPAREWGKRQPSAAPGDAGVLFSGAEQLQELRKVAEL